MSYLFSPKKIGALEIPNRFVHSATYEAMADPDGKVTDDIISRYRKLARGQVGLIIPGYMYVHPLGQGVFKQTGIHSDEMIPGLRRLADTVHEQGGRIALQIMHAGRQTRSQVTGHAPMAPTRTGRDRVYFTKPRAMTVEEIEDVIEAFGQAARRAAEAGVDAVQIHAANGYLVNQFLSPFFNRRKDDWGGSDESRFLFLKEVLVQVKRSIPGGMPVLVKLNTHDHTPEEGITPALATKYAGWLADAGVDGIEVSCGTFSYSNMNIWRGELPVEDFLRPYPFLAKLMVSSSLKKMVGRYDLVEGYNLDAARVIRPFTKRVPLIVVGGMRTVSKMEEAVESGEADFVSMCRPFIREPHLVKRIREGKAEAAACVSCNKCAAGVFNGLKVACYTKGLP